ncbi:MAG: hypothetical protein KC492_03535, partial [Myxococcales bacterium]|nr:hypothetical protein [Myxococcales bacterium]
MLQGRTALALGVASLLGTACSSLIGLDEFKAADGTGGTSGVGAAGGLGGNSGGVGGSSVGGAGAGGGGSSAGGTSGGAGGSPECAPMATQSCYTGEPATLNKGICVEGTQKCGNDGTWGACTNEVLPSVEDCSVPDKDENCDGFECGIWGLASGGTKPVQSARGDGGVVVAAVYEGEIASGPFLVPTSAKEDAFVASIQPSGDVDWVTPIASSEDDTIIDISVAPNGTTYILGYVGAPVNLGAGQLATGYFVASIDSSGIVSNSFQLS